MLSIGTSVMDDRAGRDRRGMLPLDTTFTGRTDIWTFAVQALQARLPTLGYGLRRVLGHQFGAQNCRKAWNGRNTPRIVITDISTPALAMGLPGLALLIGVLAIAPLRNVPERRSMWRQ